MRLKMWKQTSHKPLSQCSAPLVSARPPSQQKKPPRSLKIGLFCSNLVGKMPPLQQSWAEPPAPPPPKYKGAHIFKEPPSQQPQNLSNPISRRVAWFGRDPLGGGGDSSIFFKSIAALNLRSVHMGQVQPGNSPWNQKSFQLGFSPCGAVHFNPFFSFSRVVVNPFLNFPGCFTP
jgi:hypothetical protein